jgi:hypothetical protein
VSEENGDAGNVTRAARTTLDAWRERGADRHDPIRFLFIDALNRRAASYEGETRRLLDEKVSALIGAYAGGLARAESAGVATHIAAAASPPGSARRTLAELTDYIASHVPPEGNVPATVHVTSRRSSYPELEALEYFRATWSTLRSGKQLRQSLKKAPGNAGPLNSSSLVHRSLSLMRELSPGYLQQFLSYLDALSWMEQMNGSGALPAKDGPRATAARKTARNKSR